ncbi:MAG: phosphoribosylamine--glycine ligase [Nitrospinota bacterium]
MRILIVGGGGREHALAWKLSQSPGVSELFCAPGNAGTARLGMNVALSPEDIPGLLAFAKEKRIGLTVVGPEAPLVAGIADSFEAEGLKAFGPSKGAARLEGSKVFAKELMQAQGIPTAPFRIFDQAEEARHYVKALGRPCVVKADGLAGGKGAIVCEGEEEALSAIDALMVKRIFGPAGERVIVEERLYGEEASYIAFVDGEHILPMTSSQDHKPIGDGDRGPNTGGMGAYCPAPVVTPEVEEEILETIMRAAVKGLAEMGTPYRGVLYAGLMISEGKPLVLEFNARFGDPETQPQLALMEGDLLPILLATGEGRLDELRLSFKPGASVCVVMAAEGYPGSYKKGAPISGLEEAEAVEGVLVFHAGTALRGGKVVTSGGRILGVTASGDDIREAIERAYRAVGKIHWEGAYFRRDIGHRALKPLRGGARHQ